MIKESTNSENKYEVGIRYGKGEIYKDLLNLEFKDESNQEYTILELLNKPFLNETEIKELRKKINDIIANQNAVDKLLTLQIDILSKKVARLEVLLEESKGV